MSRSGWDHWVTGMPDQLTAALSRYDDASRLKMVTARDAADDCTRRRHERRLRFSMPGIRRRTARRMARPLLTSAPSEGR